MLIEIGVYCLIGTLHKKNMNTIASPVGVNALVSDCNPEPTVTYY